MVEDLCRQENPAENAINRDPERVLIVLNGHPSEKGRALHPGRKVASWTGVF